MTGRGGSAGDPPADAAAGRDEVDRITAAWRRVRPDLDVGPLDVLSRVSRLAHRLEQARAAAFGRHGLESWEFDVLAALRRAGPPHRLTAGALLAETLVTSGTMTNRVDRLAARELVRRRADPEDGRRVVVELTPAGRQRLDGALDALLAQENVLLAGIGDDERTDLARLLRSLLLSFEAERATTPFGERPEAGG